MPSTPSSFQTVQAMLMDDLVSHLVPNAPISEGQQQLARKVRASLRATGESRREWFEHRVTLQGLADKASINVQDDLADALRTVVSSLDLQSVNLGHELGDRALGQSDITKSALPLHVQFLLALANPADARTHLYAHGFLHPLPEEETEEQKLYREIMSEPFEGAHWRASREKEVGSEADWELSSNGSDVSSGFIEEIRTPVSIKRQVYSTPAEENVDDGGRERLVLELPVRRDEAYWMTGGSVGEFEQVSTPHGWEAFSTHRSFASLLQRMTSTPSEIAEPLRTISMHQLLREALMALSGRSGIVFAFGNDGACSILPTRPAVPQYSPVAYDSHLSALARIAAFAGRLRFFVSSTLTDTLASSITASKATARHSRTSRTIQAFAEACSGALQEFDKWLASVEESTLPGTATSSEPVIVTVLSLQRDLSPFHAPLLDSLALLTTYATSPHELVNHLYGLLSSLPASSPTLRTLTAIFIATASPQWSLLGDWLTSGMPIPFALSSSLESSLQVLSAAEAEREVAMDPEFFLHRNHDVSWADEDFWSDGFAIEREEWPIWLDGEDDEVRRGVVESGKAMGLLRVMGVDLALGAWPSLAEVLSQETLPANATKVAGVLDHRKTLPPGHGPPRPSLSPLAPSSIPSLLSAFLIPHIQLVQRTVRQSLASDCGMLNYLDALDDVFALRDGGVIHDWSEWLYDRMQAQLPWTSFQLLNSSYRDAVTEHAASRITPSRCRLSYAGRQPVEASVRSLGKLTMDYEIPFPLSLVLTPTSLRLRSEVFVLLLQVRLARHALVQMIYRDPLRSGTRQLTKEQHAMLKTRQKLLWFTRTIWSYLMEHAIEPKLVAYREKLQSLASMEDLIDADLEHTRSTHRACFLHPDNTTTHDTLLAIFDLAFRSAFDDPSHVDEVVSDFVAGVDELARDPSTPAHAADDWRVLAFTLGGLGLGREGAGAGRGSSGAWAVQSR